MSEEAEKKVLLEYTQPAILWFSRQNFAAFWESEAVLDRMEEWLKAADLAYRRYAKEGNALGYIETVCITGEHYDKIRRKFKEVRGLLE